MFLAAVHAQEKPAGKQAESWAAELKLRDLQTVDIGLAIGACPQEVVAVVVRAGANLRAAHKLVLSFAVTVRLLSSPASI